MSINQTTTGAGGGEINKLRARATGVMMRCHDRARLSEEISKGTLRDAAKVIEDLICATDPDDPAAIASAPPAGQGNGVPAGWKLVPVEPTPKMVAATWNDPIDAKGGIESQNARNKRVYSAMLASAPPAPTPDAGSDLAGQDAGATAYAGYRSGVENDPDAQPVLFKRWDELSRTTKACWAAAEEASRRLVKASASPPPGEDLAGQGEPVAADNANCRTLEGEICGRLYDGEGRLRFTHEDRLIDVLDHRLTVGETLDMLRAASPAPSRPADQGLTEDDLVLLMAREWLNASDSDGSLIESVSDFAMWSPEDYTACRKVATAILKHLALRDAPRTGGDGWRPMAEAPKDGTWFWAFYPSRCPEDRQQVCRWRDRRGWEDHADSMNSDPTHWRPLPAPPSPNAGDGSQETQGGGK